MFKRKYVFGGFPGGDPQRAEGVRRGEAHPAGDDEGARCRETLSMAEDVQHELSGVRNDEESQGAKSARNGECVQEPGNARKEGAPEVILVRADDLYSPERGFGFVVERNRRDQERLRLPELNSAFDTVYWYQGEDLSHVEEGAEGCFLDSDREVAALESAGGEAFQGERRRIPLSFKADVPHQGNYRVTVTIRAAEPMEDVLIFTGRRRLGYHGAIGAGEDFVYTMSVNVCDIIPRGLTEVYEDKSLDITVLARRPGFSQVVVEELECPTLFIAGDSTVTDQSAEYPYTSGTSYSGWGQMISGYLDGHIAVSNHAHSGLTTASFREEGHYGIVEKYIRPGDFLLIQFAHNDQKLESLKAEEGYRANLLRYIRECRERGAFPILVTPLARNTWKGNDGSYNDLLEEYAAVCIRVGEQENVPVADLHRRSMDFIVKTGLEASKSYFFPGDYTHSNDYGAYFMAGMVADEIVRVCRKREDDEYRFLARCITGGFGEWPVPDRIVPLNKPEKYGNMVNPEDVPVLSDIENLSEPTDRVSALDMVIRTARFFPTNVYNDMFTDVVGHEWYAGTVECAYQNGMIDPGMVEDGKFCPLRPVTLEEFLVFAVNGYKSRRKLPDYGTEAVAGEGIKGKEAGSFCVYDGKCREFARPYVRAACGLGWIPCDGSAEPGRVLTRGEAVELCRKLGL